MNHGWLEQIGTPNEIYEYPNSCFSASFIGTTNLFECKITENTRKHAGFSSNEVDCQFRVNHGIDGALGQTIWLAVRPEKVIIDKEPPDEYNAKHPTNVLRGKVEDIAYLGGLSTYHVRLANQKVIKSTDFNIDRKADHRTWGDEVYLWLESDSLMVLKS